MIARVFRAKVRPGKQAEFQQKGMLAYYPGKPLDLASDEFVMITLWEDLDALKAFAGENWNRPIIPEEELPLLEQTFVHPYEVFGGS